MEWKEYSKEIKNVLGLEGSPVAITYSMKAPASASRDKHRVCDVFLDVRDGKVVDMTESNSSCSGGSWHLGLCEPPKGEQAKALKEFLVDGEKLFCSIAAFHRSQALSTPPPLGLAEHVVFSPMEKAEFRPDVVLFVCNVEQACRLLTLDGYDTGIPARLETSGSTCHQAVAYPVVSGELNLSLMDYTSRRIRGYGAGDMLVSIPYHRFHGVMRSIDRCTAGRAKMQIPEAFRDSLSEEARRELEK
ncbi:MAG: DUF169 domain-containing protein [Candidatus Eiseniibacteriota bacterium]|nr:MAG: DUF169 domain-containing protein [Candidatus Eisenbacteria bacterium]